MNLKAIIDEVADDADDFLAGASNRTEARAGIAERLTIDYPHLSPDDRAMVTDRVMAILEEEDFFAGGGPANAARAEEGDGGEEEERG